MKYFLIGIDGAQEELFFRFNLPFIQENLSKGVNISLEEDLIGRGWSEICTGVHASESGAFYERMLMDGSYTVSSEYKLLDELKVNTNIIPLWDALNANGYSVGIMNVPTTNIAPKVNGFFVSGGGGGAKVTSEIEDAQCYPKNIKDVLIDNNYIADERLLTLLLEDNIGGNNNYFFSRLKLMNEKRVDSYLRLNNEFNVNFGFIVFRSIVVVENIFSAEIDRFLKGDKSVNMDIISKLRDFYLHFDSCLERLCKGVNAQKIGFISDHGTAPKYNIVNINFFLKKLGYQNEVLNIKSYIYLLKTLKRYIPHSIKKILKGNTSIMPIYYSIVNFDKNTSRLFNINLGSSSGVYVNDRIRFNGCVEPDNIKNVMHKFIREFNSFAMSKKHNLIAVDCSEKKNGKHGKYYPDILIRMPEGYQVENLNEVRSSDFVTPSYNSYNPVFLKDVKHDLWTGTKARRPMATFLNHEFLNDNLCVDHDLTCVYHIVKKEFNL